MLVISHNLTKEFRNYVITTAMHYVYRTTKCCFFSVNFSQIWGEKSRNSEEQIHVPSLYIVVAEDPESLICSGKAYNCRLHLFQNRARDQVFPSGPSFCNYRNMNVYIPQKVFPQMFYVLRILKKIEIQEQKTCSILVYIILLNPFSSAWISLFS